MGDPKRIRKKYDTPIHPWIKSRIEDEKRISKEFGTKNKKEIWKMETVLKRFKSQAKKLISLETEQSQKETKHLFDKVSGLGLASTGINYDTVLSLSLDDLMNRRLQSVIVAKGLARSVKQARQLIVHEHITVDGKVISSPSYLVTVKEESTVSYAHNSPLFSESHPERPGNAVEEETATPVTKDVKEEAKETPKAESKEEAPKTQEVKEESKKEDVKAEATEEVTPEVKEESEPEGEKA